MDPSCHVLLPCPQCRCLSPQRQARRGFAARTTIAPHGPLSSSTIPFALSPSQIFRMTGASLNPYRGNLQQTGSAAPVSTTNWNPLIGLRNPSCANTSQYDLIMSVIRCLFISSQPSQLAFLYSSCEWVKGLKVIMSVRRLGGCFCFQSDCPSGL